MYDLEYLAKKIETLRCEMELAITELEELTNHTIISKSQELDDLLNLYDKLKARKFYKLAKNKVEK